MFTALSSAASFLVQRGTTYGSTYSSTSSSADGGVAIVIMVVYCCIFALLMLIPIGLAVFVYKDAKKSNVENPALWALLSCFFVPLGIIIYFLVAKKDAQTKAASKATSKSDSTPAA